LRGKKPRNNDWRRKREVSLPNASEAVEKKIPQPETAAWQRVHFLA